MVRLLPGVCALVALGVLMQTAPSVAAQAAAGEELFRKNRQTCQSLVADGARRVGPSLHQVFGRKAGTLDGFAYSAALQKTGFAWTAEAVVAWLTNPRPCLPGTYMRCRQSDLEIRSATIGYLESVAGTNG